jgi:hypothetical protein
LDPAILAHAQRTAHNRTALQSALIAMLVISALLALGVQSELSAPRARFEHAANVLALPFFAIFCDTILLGAFADPDLPNARIGALSAIAFCFATLSIASYTVGLWWALGHPYRPRPSLPAAPESEVADETTLTRAPGAPRSLRLMRWVWWNPPVTSRPFAPIVQVALLAPTLAIAVAQAPIIWVAQTPQLSDTRLFACLGASIVSAVIVTTLFIVVYQRAAPNLPRFRRV